MICTIRIPNFKNDLLCFMKRYLSFFLFFFSIIQSANATHNRAGEISYQYIGNFNYRITVTTYTKASSVQADRDSLQVLIGCDPQFVDSLWVIRMNGPGNQGQLLGNDIKMNTYVAIYSFSGPGLYCISMSDPNRIQGIKNILNSVQVPFFLTDTLIIFEPGTITPNNSPVLENPPIDFACLFTKFEHNPAAFDIDGDILRYSLIPPLSSFGVDVPGYLMPDQISPGPNNIISIDSITGDLVWDAPQQPGIYNVAILIREFRVINGFSLFLGSMIRDMQIIVLEDCDNEPPIVQDVIDTCVIAGDLLDVEILAADVDGFIDSLSAYGGPFVIPNPATFGYTVSGIGNTSANGFFEWQTDCDHIRKEFYSVVFKATSHFLIANNDTVWSVSDLETWLIRVIGPAPQNLVAAVSNSSIDLSWDNPYVCSGGDNFQGFSVWRKNGCDPFIPENCDNDLSAHGYVKIADLLQTYTYTDNAVIPGNAYSYRVQAEFGNLSPDGFYIIGRVASMPSNEVCTELHKDLPVIINVSVTETDIANGKIYVRWTKPETDSNGLDTIAFPPPYTYAVHRADGMNSQAFLPLISFTANSFSAAEDTFFTDTALNTVGIAYKYRIEFHYGVNGAYLGATQDASSVFLTINPSNNKLKLSWDENVPWTNYKYRIWKNDPPATNFILIDSTTFNTYTDFDVVNDSLYCYYIEAVGHYTGTGLPDSLINFSQQVCDVPVDTVPPCAPLLTVTNNCDLNGETPNLDDLANNLSWTNIPGCSEDIASYNIYYAPTVLAELVLIATVDNPDLHSYVHQLTTSLAGCYTIQAIDSSENIGAISEKVCVDNCPVYVLPNVFTPNNDGDNDLFTPFMPYYFVDHVKMKIFNRWGQLVYQTENADINWDGRDLKGRNLSEGIYFYGCDVFEVRVNGVVRGMELKGFIHLIRGGNGTN